MNLQSIVTVAVRLIALLFAAQSVMEIGPGIIMIIEAFNAQSTHASLSSTSLWGGVMIFGRFVVAVLIWVLAPLLAHLATHGVKSDIQIPQLTVTDCYSVGFVLVGVWFVIKHLALGLTWAHYLFLSAVSTSGTTWREKINWYDVLEVFLTLVFGVVLIVFGCKWAVLLARKQQRVESVNQTRIQEGAEPVNSQTE